MNNLTYCQMRASTTISNFCWRLHIAQIFTAINPFIAAIEEFKDLTRKLWYADLSRYYSNYSLTQNNILTQFTWSNIWQRKIKIIKQFAVQTRTILHGTI